MSLNLQELFDLPHLIIQYSANVENTLDMQSLCSAMYDVMLSSGVFPLAGIRVRAFSADHALIADQLPENGFVDMVLRIGEGRSAADKKQLGQSIMTKAESVCAELLSKPHFALSLEIVEISREFSWKTNTMHARLAKAEKPGSS